MNRIASFLLIVIISLLSNSCADPEKINIVCDHGNITSNAGNKLAMHLSNIYPSKIFEISGNIVDGSRNIVLEISNATGLENDETFIISGKANQLSILGKTPRALINGVYGLLEKMGYGFYLSMESRPEPQKEIDFNEWNFSDTPLVGERIVFNWHNFLSGCSTWDLSEWKDWIDHSSSMRFNMIMVHAYGNNPMFVYSLNGKQKKTSPFPGTQGGRDYGTQQVNDVRRLYGGEVFENPVFGNEVSQVDPEHQVETVQTLMEEVFNHAEAQGMKVCFAFDIDTYPANPQDLIKTLPASARFYVPLQLNSYLGRYHKSIWMANPDTPEGFEYYKSQIVALLKQYPQIDQVALWMRKSGSEWLSLREHQLPMKWQAEYRKIMNQHPDYAKWEDAPGRFAVGRMIASFQRALSDIEREDIVLRAGSWAFDWMDPADVFFPENIGFIGLDYNVLRDTSDIDIQAQQQRMTRISQNRSVIPVFWAHHDDGAFMGRPYVPVSNLQKKLEMVGADGMGIIHWTTWPLDPYFKNMASQVWANSLNQDYEITIEKMARDLFGQRQHEKASSYLFQWATTAPMMGRETREWFIDHEFTELQVQAAEEGYKHRMTLLETINNQALTETGKKFLGYFKGIEDFSMEFYRTESDYQHSMKLLADGNIDKAREAIMKCDPEKLITQFARFSQNRGITKGEQGLIISLNLDWVPYIENQRQALGISPIRYNFAPTIHPKFGQGILRTNFFKDNEHNLWRNYGTEETGIIAYELGSGLLPDKAGHLPEAFEDICFSGIESDSTIRINLKTIMADIKPLGSMKNWISTSIMPGKYQLSLLFAHANGGHSQGSIMDLLVHNHLNQPAVITERIEHTDKDTDMMLKSYQFMVPDMGEVIIELKPVKGNANICGAILQWISK